MTRPALAMLALALALGLWLRCVQSTAPIEEGARGINTSWYAGQSVKHYREHGFVATCGAPVLQSWPGTLEECVRYVSHPAPMTWLWWLGASIPGVPPELGLRLIALLANLLTLPLCFFALRRHGSALAAATGTLLWATLPMSAYYGSIPSGESLLLPWMFGVWILHSRWRVGSTRFSTLLLTVFAGCCIDWVFYWAIPALALGALVEGTLREQRAALLKLFCAAVVAFLLYGAHMSLACGGVGAFISQLTASLGLQKAPADAALGFLAAQWHFARALYGPGAILVASAGALLWCGGRARATRGPALFATAIGVLHVVVFAHHAADHDFWTIPLCFAFAAAACAVADAVSGWRQAVVVLLLLCAAAAGGMRTLELGAERATTAFRDEVASMPQLEEANCVAVVAPFWIQQLWYTKAHVYPTIDNVDKLIAMRDAYSRIYGHAARSPSLLVVTESAPKSVAGLQLDAYLRQLGLSATPRGRYFTWFLPGR